MEMWTLLENHDGGLHFIHDSDTGLWTWSNGIKFSHKLRFILDKILVMPVYHLKSWKRWLGIWEVNNLWKESKGMLLRFRDHQYWFQRYLELGALLEQVGTPTFFWTISSADVYWPDLHSLLLTQTTTHQDRLSAISSTIHILPTGTSQIEWKIL